MNKLRSCHCIAAAAVFSLSGALHAGSPESAAFVQCAVCHSLDPSGAHGVGPNLFGIFGQPMASAPGFVYSRALRKRAGTWTEAELHEWLEDPQAYAPGNKMAYAGMKDPSARQAAIDRLKAAR